MHQPQAHSKQTFWGYTTLGGQVSKKLIATPKVILPVSSFSSEGVDSRLFDSQVQVLRSMIQHFISYYKKLECSKNYNLSTNEFEIMGPFGTTQLHL
jgi:hypothetical protein